MSLVKTTFLLILFLALIGGGYWAYLNYEKPIQEEAGKVINLTLFAIDEGGNNVRTGYDLYIDGAFYHSSETLEGGGKFLQVGSNSTIEVFNRNLPGQNYYSTSDNTSINFNDTLKRLDIRLTESKPLALSANGDIGIEDIIIITMRSNNFRNVAFCIEKTSHFIWVNTNEEFERIDNPLRYEAYDSCYFTNQSITLTSDLIVDLYLNRWRFLDEGDFIEIVVFDGDEKVGQIDFGEEIDIVGEDQIIKLISQFI